MFEWLTGLHPDVRLIADSSLAYTINRDKALEKFGDMAATGAQQRGEYNVKRDGLCLIVDYCVEAIQQVLYLD